MAYLIGLCLSPTACITAWNRLSLWPSVVSRGLLPTATTQDLKHFTITKRKEERKESKRRGGGKKEEKRRQGNGREVFKFFFGKMLLVS